MQFAIHEVDPYAAAVLGQGKIGWAIHHGKVLGFGIVQKFADVDMQVALGALFEAVQGDAPMVAPQFARFGDGGGVVACESRASGVVCFSLEILFLKEDGDG